MANAVSESRGPALLLAALLLVGCDWPGANPRRLEPTECAKWCFDRAIYNLSSIDHGPPPSAEALREIREQCWSTASPCCSNWPCPVATPPEERP